MCASIDMRASDGGNNQGDAETVVVTNERRTVVRGSTDSRDGGAAVVVVCWRVSAGGWAMAIEPAVADDWSGEECMERVDVDAILIDSCAGETTAAWFDRTIRGKDAATRAAGIVLERPQDRGRCVLHGVAKAVAMSVSRNPEM